MTLAKLKSRINQVLYEWGLKNVCAACHKFKWGVKQRSYIMPKISSQPITSQGALCGQCMRDIKKLVV